MPTYNWVCHSCHASNPAGIESCAACAFPAITSANDIDAKAGIAPKFVRIGRKEYKKIRRGQIAGLPVWKRTLAYLLWFIQSCGTLLWLNFTISAFLIGLSIAVVAEFFYQWLIGALRNSSTEQHGASS